jgi:hypothetical protein
MKRILFSSMGIFIFLFAALKSVAITPPNPVLKAFSSRYPNSESVQWTQVEKKNYQAEFLLGGAKIDVVFSSSGEWQSTKSDIGVVEIPQQVKDAIMNKYPHCKIIGASYTTYAKSAAKYEANLLIGDKKTTVEYNLQNHLLR